MFVWFHGVGRVGRKDLDDGELFEFFESIFEFYRHSDKTRTRDVLAFFELMFK